MWGVAQVRDVKTASSRADTWRMAGVGRGSRGRSWRRTGGVLLRGAALLVPLALVTTFSQAGAVWSKTTVNPGDSWGAGTLQPPTGLGLSTSCPGATVTATWTATTSTYATGYTLVRKSGATVQNTINVSGRTTVSQNDTSVPNGSYTYELNSVYNNWNSSVASANTTVSCISLTNPGFETGTLSGWTCDAGVSVASNPHSGTYAATMTTSGNSLVCKQLVTGLSTNTTYTIGVWVKGTAIAGIGYDPGGNANNINAAQNANWTQVTNQFTTDASTTSMYIILFTGFSSGTAYLDDVTLS